MSAPSVSGGGSEFDLGLDLDLDLETESESEFEFEGATQPFCHNVDESRMNPVRSLTHITPRRVPGTNIRLYGDGAIGDKAAGFVAKAQQWAQLGLQSPPRRILAEGAIDCMVRRAGVADRFQDLPVAPETQQVLAQANLVEPLFWQPYLQRQQGHPMFVRSSAFGDGRGVGFYDSRALSPTLAQLQGVLRTVLSSYFSPQALEYRAQLGLDAGMGIICEPICGDAVGLLGRGGCFYDDIVGVAPVLSGHGYSSTSRGEGYVVVTAGLGGAVEGIGGERITAQDLAKHEWNLGKLVAARDFQSLKSMGFNVPPLRSVLNQNNWTYDPTIIDMPEAAYLAQAFIDRYGEASVEPHMLAWQHANGGLSTAPVQNVPLRPVFDALERSEQLFGTRQYLEFAVTWEAGAYQYWFIQGADVAPNAAGHVDFSAAHGQPVISGYHVLGEGIRDVEHLVICTRDQWTLSEFNKRGMPYILAFDSDFTYDHNEFDYRCWSNAVALLELPNHRAHAADPIGHFGGKLEATDTYFACLDREQKARVLAAYPGDDSFAVHTGQFRVAASASQNRLMLYENPPQPKQFAARRFRT